MEVMNKKEVGYTDVSDVNSLIYAPGCPVIVSRCMIFRNDSDGSLQAVLDFTSISEDILKEIDISLQGYDSDGNKTGDVIESIQIWIWNAMTAMEKTKRSAYHMLISAH